ncbi:tyrosine-type recombinase/integrase [Bradyrhizobium sp.]|uniref:tyrosine-type recombinase/integrase n=1 Tax=Bradyrhizobium sp. TaxID=376 RepID=UPI0040380FC5
MQFSVVIDAFIQFCVVERRLSPHTCAAYRFDLADFSKWARVELREISTGSLKSYMEDMAERKLSTATIRRRLACLRAFFHHACEQSGTPNPFDGWRLRLARRKQLPKSLSKVEASSLLSTSSISGAPAKPADLAIAIAIRLMVSTGLRVGELCSLQRDDVLSQGAALRVRGKGARDRIAYVSDATLSQELTMLAGQRGDNVALFQNRTGRPLRPHSIRSRLRTLAERAGLRRKLTPHMLRHTAATLLIETGVDIRFVQRLLGHSSISTTEIYTHVSDEALRTTLARANVLSTLA